MSEVEAVVFDCDGVLVDITSSWQQIHNYFGTNNKENLAKFLEKEITDDEFMELDIKLWLDIQDKIQLHPSINAVSSISLGTLLKKSTIIQTAIGISKTI